MKKIVISCIVGFIISVILLMCSFLFFKKIISDPNDFYNLMFVILNIILSFWLIIPVIALINEKYHDNKPKIIITFELIRSTLVCLVIRNIGKCDAELISLKINDEFLQELGDREKVALEDMSNIKMYIAPSKYWVLNFGINTFDIIEKFKNTTIKIDYEYRKINHKKVYKDTLNIDFKSYAHFMVYISELDELNNSIRKLTREVKNEGVNTKKLVETTRLMSKWVEREVHPSREDENNLKIT